MTPRIVCNLYMRDFVDVFLYRQREIAFYNLHMVDVVLNENVIAVDGIDELQRLLFSVHVKTRNVAAIDSLHQQLDACTDKLVRRESKIGDEGFAQFVSIQAFWRNTS